MQSKQKNTFRILFFGVLFLLFLLVGVFFLFQRFVFLPKILIFLLIIITSLFFKKFQLLIKDWLVFIGFIYLFDSLRGLIYLLICRLGLPVYTLYVINIEKFLFKGIPSVSLQNRLLDPGKLTYLEKVLTVIHGSHFVAFLLIGFFIWFHKKDLFRTYKVAFYVSAIGGLAGYLFVPTVPPWMAAGLFHRLPPLVHFNIILYNTSIPDISTGFDTNPVAAMPSLHAAFPLLLSFLLWKTYRRKAFPFFLYTLSVLFAIVYTGDHYVTDILAGLILALISYVVALWFARHKEAVSCLTAESKSGHQEWQKPLLLGFVLFFAGFLIGNWNKYEFTRYSNRYSLNAPRYIDFFKHGNTYKSDFAIQFYFGKHYVTKGLYQQALPYFQQCLRLAPSPRQQKSAEQQILFCTRMIEATQKW
jgi:hypothetical protein